VLDQLFGAAMQQADMRIDALDDLAVEFEDQRNTPCAAGAAGRSSCVNLRIWSTEFDIG
jgi:hypothetical protein